MSVDRKQFLAAAALSARQVGVVMRRLQGQVVNEGKAETHTPGEDERIRQMRSAKTAVDDMAQDLLLAALAPHLPVGNTFLDGEEETPGKALLPALTGGYLLVLDPLDGTLVYLEQGDTYAVHIGLFHAGEIAVALVYYPAQDVAYWTAGAGQGVYRGRDFFLQGLAAGERMTLPSAPASPRHLFVYYQVEEEVRAALSAAGFTHARTLRSERDSNPVEALFSGAVAAALVRRMQTRDIIPAALLVGAGACLTDWSGQPIRWPEQGGPMPRAVISPWPLDPVLAGILKSDATRP